MKVPSPLLPILLAVVGISVALSFFTPRYGPGIGPSRPPHWAEWDERQREEWLETRHREAKEQQESQRRQAKEWQEREAKERQERYEKCQRGGLSVQEKEAPDVVTGARYCDR